MAEILVTGSEGSLMQAVIPKLLENDHYITGVDNLYRYGQRRNLTDTSKYAFVKGDLTDQDFVYKLLYDLQPQVIIQGAAMIYGVGGFHDHCADILSDDIAIQTNLLKASLKSQSVQQFVYISSSMVYENCPQDWNIPVSEGMPNKFPVPTTDYGLSKYVGERLCKAYWEEYRLPFLIWRPFNIITPHEPVDGEQGIAHVFADYLRMIAVDKLTEMPIIGDGNQVRCFTWIEEVAQAIADYSVNNVQTINGTFNLGNQEPITMRTLAQIIYDEATAMGIVEGKKPLTFYTTKSFADDVKIRIPDTNFTEITLGWKAQQKVRESVRKCLEVLQTQTA